MILWTLYIKILFVASLSKHYKFSTKLIIPLYLLHIYYRGYRRVYFLLKPTNVSKSNNKMFKIKCFQPKSQHFTFLYLKISMRYYLKALIKQNPFGIAARNSSIFKKIIHRIYIKVSIFNNSGNWIDRNSVSINVPDIWKYKTVQQIGASQIFTKQQRIKT